MQDTTIEMRKKQYEIVFQMSESQRFAEGIKMIQMGRVIVENSIKEQNPQITELEMRIAVFKRYYSRDFSKPEMDNIVTAFYAHDTLKKLLP